MRTWTSKLFTEKVTAVDPHGGQRESYSKMAPWVRALADTYVVDGEKAPTSCLLTSIDAQHSCDTNTTTTTTQEAEFEYSAPTEGRILLTTGYDPSAVRRTQASLVV